MLSPITAVTFTASFEVDRTFRMECDNHAPRQPPMVADLGCTSQIPAQPLQVDGRRTEPPRSQS
jgi:hypothetical protein